MLVQNVEWSEHVQYFLWFDLLLHAYACMGVFLMGVLFGVFSLGTDLSMGLKVIKANPGFLYY